MYGGDNMLGEEIPYQVFACYILYIVVSCIIILIIVGIFKFIFKLKNKKKINSMEKNVQLIYEELKKLNEKVDRIYNNDSDDFIDK